MISTNQFKNGNHIEVDGTIFKILEFQHVKPGKGGAFVRTKLRRAARRRRDRQDVPRRGEVPRRSAPRSRKMQFLYADGTDAHFMDSESYEQIAIPEDDASPSALRWTKPNDEVDLLFIDDQPADVQLASAVELEVTETEPGVRGDTASGGGNKPATLETGATIQRPAVRQHRRPGAGRHALRRVRARARSEPPMPAAPTSAAPPSSRSTSTTSPAASSTTCFERDAATVHARARARGAGPRPRTRRADRAPREGLDGRPHRAAGARDHARRAARDAAPRRVAGRDADPAGGRDRRGRRDAPRRSAAPTRPGFVNGILAAVLREMRENGAHA